MSYKSFDAFKEDAVSCGPVYYSDDSLVAKKMEIAYQIYLKSFEGAKLYDLEGNAIDSYITIVGRLALKKMNPGATQQYTWVPSNEEFPSIDEIMRQNFGTMDEEAEHSGSILNAKNWSLLANDAWLLGGIHAHTVFHFASPLSWDNLWDQADNRISVTAREVIGILSHGFEIIRPNPKLEAVAITKNSGLSSTASLLSYKSAVEKFSSQEGIAQFYKNLPEEVTHY